MKKGNFDQTMMFNVKNEDEVNEARQILKEVYEALKEKGYNPINQLVGYLLSGIPLILPAIKMLAAISGNSKETIC